LLNSDALISNPFLPVDTSKFNPSVAPMRAGRLITMKY